jgi:hypothetical protein
VISEKNYFEKNLLLKNLIVINELVGKQGTEKKMFLGILNYPFSTISHFLKILNDTGAQWEKKFKTVFLHFVLSILGNSLY